MKRCCYLILCLICGSPCLRAGEVSRVLKTLDFEERRLGNNESLPMHWVKLQGPGLPHYVNGQLATDRHHSGEYSFRFDLNGGSLIYRYAPGQVSVQTGAHYRIDAWCQTTPLAHARARLSAFLADADGHRIPNTTQHSELYAATQDNPDAWKRLSVEVTADSPAAASLVLELQLIQPELYVVPKPGPTPLFEQDIHGSAWWDDVTISQVPQVSMRTGRPGNVFGRNDPLRLGVFVSDRSTDDLVAQLSVRDAEDREVYQRTGRPDVRPTEGDAGPRGMVLELPSLPPGWYQARLSISGEARSLGSQSLAFVVLPDSLASAPPDGRFGFIATDLPFQAWEQLPQVLPMLSAGRVKLAVWSERGDVEQIDSAAFDRLLDRFSQIGITPTACLTQLPPAVADRLGKNDWKQILRVPPESWRSDLAFLVSRHANHLDRWQLGADGSSAFVTDPKMREVYRRVLSEFSQLIEKPDLAMPWPAWYELSGQLPATIALDVPPSILPEQLPLYIREIRDRSDHNLSLTLELPDRARYGRTVQIRDLAQRMIYAMAAGAGRIDLPLPFTASEDQSGVTLEPQELLLVMRTLIATLSGAQFKGRVSIGEGIEAFLFDQAGRGILVLWNRADTTEKKQLALNLGERPVSVDLWGNVAPLPRPPGDRRGRVDVAIGSMPIFLVDIDGPQAQLRASVAIDRPAIESSFKPHTRRVRFTNTYSQALSGALHLKAPTGWTINPPTFNFALNPGETFERDLTLQFPYNSVAGAKTLDCEFYLEGQNNSQFTVPLALRLGLSDVGMQTIAMRDGADVFVQQTITNYGDAPISYNAFAIYPRRARQERLITGLAPGATTIRRYRFENATRTDGAKVRVGLKEMSGTRILNDEVPVQ
jgi:hypothetical protein